jgi:hypothetical protein
MMYMRRIAGWMFFVLAILGAATSLSAEESAATDAKTGELKLDGAFVERLKLASKDGRIHTIDLSAERVTLPQGEYTIHEVRLQGGYTCESYQAGRAEWITVRAGQQATLKVGAPLRHEIRLDRGAAVLTVAYELIGQGGERYNPVQSGSKPRFVVYRNGKEVFTDDFEFG